jgi:methylated-DNA-[protein]-cysteine S-methyltransferase
MLKYTTIPVPFGSVVVVAEGDVLREICMTRRDPDTARTWLGKTRPDLRYDARLMPTFQKQIRDYAAGRPVRFDADFDISHMTAFQRRVLQACAQLDYGQTVTYGELARRIGHPTASRAVGAALGRNPLPLVIPCHRVVGCNGSLGGFSAEQGLKVKRWLLDLEAGGSRKNF